MNETVRNFVDHKAALANDAVRKHGVKSFADIGGCWGVHAAYTVDILEKNAIDKAYVADGNVNPQSRAAGAPFPQLEFIEGQFNEHAFIEPFPQVDALIMYSILVHQANLDWDAFLEAWSKKARVIVIYNQMWKKTKKTVRFPDQGLKWYLRNVFFSKREIIVDWFQRLDEPYKNGRKWRDAHHYWQVGITTADLVGKMKSLGFRLDFHQNYGPFHHRRTPWIENEGFVFVRDNASEHTQRHAGEFSPISAGPV